MTNIPLKEVTRSVSEGMKARSLVVRHVRVVVAKFVETFGPFRRLAETLDEFRYGKLRRDGPFMTAD